MGRGDLAPRRRGAIEGEGPCRRPPPAIAHLQAPTSLPLGMSHFLEAQTTSRLQDAPAACGGLQT